MATKLAKFKDSMNSYHQLLQSSISKSTNIYWEFNGCPSNVNVPDTVLEARSHIGSLFSWNSIKHIEVLCKPYRGNFSSPSSSINLNVIYCTLIIARYFQISESDSWNELFCITLPRTYRNIIIFKIFRWK